VSRLETEGGGKVLVDERDALTTVLAASTRFLRERPEEARRALRAHRELTRWLAENPAEAKARVREELLALTTREIPADLLDRCWERMRFDDAVSREEFDVFVKAAGKAGLLAESHDLSRLVEEIR
jgi:NitT/TauT family transport system substrate-binding protein